MSYYIKCFKSYVIEKMPDSNKDYEFKRIDECMGDYIYPSTLLEINEYLGKYNLTLLYTLIPLLGEDTYFEEITIEEANNIANNFIEPSKCIEYVKKNEVIDKIYLDKPNDHERMIFVLKHLMDKWQSGYYVYEGY